MGEIRMRMGPDGLAAVHALQEFAVRGTGDKVDVDESLEFVLRFVREVDPRERERVLAVLRRPRLSIPGR